jgi:catechol 2,3-dioxygenase-like lactoylglutathione lyase family enzyme
MAAILKAVRPVLGARDVAATVQWYVERLGFTCAFDDGGATIRYAGISRDGVEIHLQWQDERYFPAPGEDAPAYRFLVDDPDTLHAECTGQRGLRPTAALRDTPWGTREFGVYDPNGHGLDFYKPLS